MSPNNQNEYEIIDMAPSTSVSNDSNRYPFASDPTNALQNMNYKEYLRMSEGYDSEYSGSPEVLISERDAVKTAISLVGTILGKLGVPLVGPIVSLYSTLIDVLWPGGKSQWEIFMEQVEALINQKIAEYARAKALAELEGLGNNYQLYLTALEEWQENPSSTRVLRDVRNRFEILDSLFTQYMPSFRVTGYEVPLLSVYAQAANLHLLLLKDASIFGEEWGFSTTAINNYYNRQMSLIAQYSDHCVQWYRTGLDRLKGSNAKQWVEYNRFRREMTLSVLDIMTLFPMYDMRTYPMETKAQLTREVYTDPIGAIGAQGSWYDSAPSFNTLESTFIRGKHLFDFITRLSIYTGRSSFSASNYLKKWIGHQISSQPIGGSIQTQTYGTTSGSSVIATQQIGFTGFDVYKTLSTAGVLFAYTSKYYGVSKVVFDAIYPDNKYKTTFTYNPGSEGIGAQEKDSEVELPPETLDQPNYEAYSHRLNYVTFIRNPDVPVFSWTHRSADRTASRNNFIYATKISQIPINKASRTSGGAVWNFQEGLYNGGPVMKLSGSGSQVINLRVATDAKGASQRYRIRIRYASDRAGKFTISSRSPENPATYSASIAYTNTMSTNASLTYSTFAYAESGPINLGISGSSRTFDISITKEAGAANLYIDRIEFIPVNTLFEAEEDLDVAKKAVNGLFTNEKDALQTSVTDYQVNQAANLIECLSDELYPNEKRMLWDAVKEAKRLVQARNLLQDTGFNRINGENGWTGSTGIEVVEGDVLFKDRSLRLTNAREIDTETYPTYLYQQIDESLLKPCTRYKLKGFIGSSQDLEIKLIRHRANQIVKNVPDNLLPDVRPVNSCGGVDRCSEQQYVDANLALENNGENGNMSFDSHAFSFHIDTGEIDLNENTGIWIVFKIPTTNGNATLGNLEFVEEGPLSGETLEWAQQQEQQWQDKMARKRAASEKTYYAAKQAIDRLFADYQDQKLNSGVEMSDLLAAQNLVQSIPYVYNDALPEIPGMNYTSFTELTNRLQQAWNLYDLQNAIPNGDFRNGLSNWNATSDVNVQQLSDTSVLVIPNWNSQVSQQFTVQPNYRYVLCVTARKEGVGDGYVIIRDGANQTETLTFNICDDDTGVLSTDQTSYITKTVEFTPSTEQVWIDMSETEGVFNIESVELVLEEE
uniref:Crystaline entomocidal protoxin n=1 Tax=Bacillus thuringiensis TaxID=1428 RepID=F4MHU2_BACTU|nr:delta-endotoxin [Bacillus thuringiensis]